jgi:hypothetical protein
VEDDTSQFGWFKGVIQRALSKYMEWRLSEGRTPFKPPDDRLVDLIEKVVTLFGEAPLS